jgi:hypothetical protein
MTANTEVTAIAAIESTKAGNWQNHALATASLSAVALFSVWAERNGVNKELITPYEEMANSCAHPVLGYAGAWIGTKVVDRFSDAYQRLKGDLYGIYAAVATASSADYSAEKIQSELWAAPQYENFLSAANLPETAKDYLAVIGGLGLFYAIDRIRRPEE